MTETSSVALKALETETGKFIAEKIFGKLENTLRSNACQREIDDILDSITPINHFMSQQFFERVVERYLTFRTLLSRDRDVFIDEIYHPLRILSLDSNKEQEISDYESNFHHEKIACIIGKAGQGKTTILRKIFLNNIKSSNSELALIITLRKVDWTKNDLSLESIVSNEFESLGVNISPEACSTLLMLRRIKLLFDGFDEVANEFRGKAINIITQVHLKYEGKCIVTSRPGTEIQLHGGAVKNFHLLDLKDTDVIKIIEKHTSIEEKDKELLIHTIKTKEYISQTLVTPILVDIFISTYSSLNEDPKSIIDFYEQIFMSLASTHDRLKVLFERNGDSDLTNRQLEAIFWNASYKLINKRNDITFTEKELSDAFDNALNENKLNAENAHIDVINKTSLIKQDGIDFSYIHKSIAEFSAAKHICSLSDEVRKAYYQGITENYKESHENILRNLSLIDEDLFYINFAKPLIERIRSESGITNDNELTTLTANLLFASIGFRRVVISTTQRKDNTETSMREVRELNSEERDEISRFVILSTVLDITPPSISLDSLQNLILDKIHHENMLQNRKAIKIEHREHVTKDEGAVTDEIRHYEFDINEIIDIEADSKKILKEASFALFAEKIQKMEALIVKHEKGYASKNALESLGL